MLKKELVAVGFVFFLVLSFVSAGHSGNNIFLKVNNADTILQTAINTNNFKTLYVGSISSSSIIFGHNADDVIVNVNGSVKTFAMALSDGSLSSSVSGRSPSIYSGYNLIHGEYATNILVSNSTTTISLQQAINDGWFYVCVPKTCSDLNKFYGYWEDGCGNTLNCWDSSLCTFPWECYNDSNYYYMAQRGYDDALGSYCFSSFFTKANCRCHCPSGWTEFFVRSDIYWTGCGSDGDWGIGCQISKN